MRFLIAEDDFVTSQVMKEILSNYGDCTIAMDGAKAIEEFTAAHASNDPYNCIFLDIMMPEKDGQEVLLEIKKFEASLGIQGLDGARILMTTALDDFENIRSAFKNQCDGYIVKPIDVEKVTTKLSDLGII